MTESAQKFHLHQAVIHTDSLLNKHGNPEPSPSIENGILSGQQIETRLNQIFGISFHASLREVLSQKLLANNERERLQPELDLAPRPSLESLFGYPINSFSEFQAALTKTPLQQLNPDSLKQAMDWLESLNPYRLSKKFKTQISETQLQYCHRERTTAIMNHAVLLIGLLETWPPLNDPNSLVLPEVRLQPKVTDLSRLGTQLNKPLKGIFILPEVSKNKKPIPTVKLNLKRALQSSEPFAAYLHRVLIKREPLLNGFEDTIGKLIELDIVKTEPAFIHLCRSATEAEFINSFREAVKSKALSLDEMETILSLRLISRAQTEMLRLFGGKTTKITQSRLMELLKIFPMIANPTDKKNHQLAAKILKKMPKGIRKILSPINLALDVLIINAPEDITPPQQEILTRLKTYVAKIYSVNKQPALLQDNKFMALFEQASQLGLTVEIGDLKSSRQPISLSGVKAEHFRELAFYNLTVFSESVAAYLIKTYPEKHFNAGSILAHPMVKALTNNFIIYCGWNQKQNQATHSQIDIRTAFTNPTQDRKLMKRFITLAHQVIDSMMIRHVSKITGFVAGDDD